MNDHDPKLDEDLQHLIDTAKAHYNDPPAPPAASMWEALEPRLASSPRRWAVAPWAAVAAGLVLALGGIGLGRWIAAPAPEQIAEGTPNASDPESLPLIPAEEGAPVLRFAAYQHLVQTAGFLERFDTVGAPEVAHWGKRLLTDTRLLLDTSVSDDAELRRLLEDLELILAQVVQLAGDRGRPQEQLELEQLNRGLEDQAVLPRIREIVPPVLSTDEL